MLSLVELEKFLTNPLDLFIAIARRMNAGESTLRGKSFEEWVIDSFERFRVRSSVGYVLEQNKGKKESTRKSDSVSTGLAGQFPDLLLSKNGEETLFVECKGEEGLQDLQFNSTPPCGINEKKGKHYRTFYILGSRRGGRVERIALVDGYYFNSDVELIDKVWEFVADSLEQRLPHLQSSWQLIRRGKGGRDIEPYITHIGSYSEDAGIRARIRRMYHVTNPLKTFANYRVFTILPKEFFPSEVSKSSAAKFKISGITLTMGEESPIIRHEIIRGNRTFDFMLVHADA
jgi:hypothetical protein